MEADEVLAKLSAVGYCIIPGAIAASDVAGITESVVAVVEKQQAAAETREAETRSKGHRIGASGVTNVGQLIGHTQSFVPYLTSPFTLGVATGLFGPFVRVSSNLGLVNHPGTTRGYWHADWPFNQTVANHVPMPYGDSVLHLSSIWMLSRFNQETGGTLVIPGSHRLPDNPSGDNGVDRDAAHPREVQVRGEPGSILVFDSRLWHSVAANRSGEARVAIVVRYAPWWLNLEADRPGTADHNRIVAEPRGKGNNTQPLPLSVYEELPAEVKPLFRHNVGR